MAAPGPSGSRAAQRRPYRLALPEGRGTPKQTFGWRIAAAVLFLIGIVSFAAIWVVTTKSVGVAIIEIPLLVLLTTPLFILASRRETRFDLAGILGVGLALRFLATYYRFTHAADAATYHNAGVELARGYRHFDFGADPGSPVPGTGGMKIITGIFEVLTNSNAFATFLVFSWLGFIGCYLFYRAFVTAMPEGDHRRYALLIFLWPTLLFWPSSIGKDCWLLFTVGIAALGAARILTRQRGGYGLLLAGLILGSFVRPHVSLILLVAFTAALLVGRRSSRPGALTPGSIGKVAGLVVLLVVGAVLATRTADLLKANDISGSVDAALAQNALRTAQGGSAFSPANPKNPIGYVQASVTVLFRPFPYEAHGLESLATSAEALFLALLALVSWRRLASIPRRLRSDPYVTMALAYTLMFFFAFGTISNFGILARERSQLMPFVFVLLCVPAVAKVDRDRRKQIKQDKHARPVRPELPRLNYRAPVR